jgi:hypothetical protein
MAKKKVKKVAAHKVDKAAVKRAAIAEGFAKLRLQDQNGQKVQQEQLSELEALVLGDA